MKITTLLLPVTIAGAIAGGFMLGSLTHPGKQSATPHQVVSPAFHDMRINPTVDYVGLIDVDHPEIIKLAKQFRTYEDAYRFVNEEIRFAPFVPPGPVEKTLEYRTGSCLGKAALLGSLYRAMGLPGGDIRLVMGLVMTPDGPADHVWLDLEHEGRCLQQDPSGMLGNFGFNDFPDNRYVDAYVMKETFCFNDSDFAVVSQLNRFRNSQLP
jgi:hypothetical protein